MSMDPYAPGPTATLLRQSTAATGTTTATPLRRISRGSLSALSASRTREADVYGPTLGHLAPAFAELAEAVEDLAVNVEALDAIDASLNTFNEAFSGFLLGLRTNAYTSDFLQAPTIRNFARNAEKGERLQREAAEAQAAEEAIQQAEAEQEERERAEGQHAGPSTADDTFVTQPGDNDMRGGRDTTRAKETARGRGGSTAGSRTGKSASTKKKEQMIKFAQPIIDTMPIDFREKQPQRSDAETIIAALRSHPEGFRLQELVKLYPLIPQHRINDCLLALVRAKHAIKVTSKGLLYRLDPMKYPSEAQ